MRSYALILFALMISASAVDTANFVTVSRAELEQYGKLEAKADVIDFLKGVAYGLDVVFGDPEACIQDVKNMTNHFNTGVQLIADGIKKVNVKNVMAGLNHMANGIERLADAFKSCGFQKLSESIIKIVVEIKSGNIKAFIRNNVIHIWGHGRELIHLFKELSAQWKSGDFYEAGKAVGEIIGILIDQTNDQIMVSATPADMFKLIRGVAQGMGSTMGDPAKCARDIDLIVANLNAAWSDLKTGLKKLSVKTVRRALQEFADAIESIGSSFESCGLSNLEKAIREIVADIRAGKLLQVIAREVVHIFCHGKDLIKDFKAASAYWTAGAFEECGKKVGAIIGFLVVIPPAAN